jgi:hypothetical protein
MTQSSLPGLRSTGTTPGPTLVPSIIQTISQYAAREVNEISTVRRLDKA